MQMFKFFLWRLIKKDVALSMSIKTIASQQYIPPEETLEYEEASLFSTSEISLPRDSSVDKNLLEEFDVANALDID